MDLYVNVLTILIQVFVTGRVIAAIGVGRTLAILPAITVGGFAALGFSPTTSVLVVFQVVRRAAEFALVKPAREVLFTVVSREEKYSSKAFIDTFVYRGGDAVGAWADRALAFFGLGAAALGVIFAPIGVGWLLTGLYLGRRQRILANLRAAEATRAAASAGALEHE